MTFRVVTYNCGSGNPKVAGNWPQMMGLPWYAAVLSGASDAPIVGLQEVSPAHARALRTHEQEGMFRMVHLSRPGQGNALLIPQRFDVSDTAAHLMIRANTRALWRCWRDKHPLNVRQLAELRLYVKAVVVDSETGGWLTVYCTHLSGSPWVRLEQAIALADQIKADNGGTLCAAGPVLLLADLNVPPHGGTEVDVAIRSWVLPPLHDLAAGCPSIDWIAGVGLDVVSCRLHTDVDLSDHWPKEARLQFASTGKADKGADDAQPSAPAPSRRANGR